MNNQTICVIRNSRSRSTSNHVNTLHYTSDEQANGNITSSFIFSLIPHSRERHTSKIMVCLFVWSIRLCSMQASPFRGQYFSKKVQKSLEILSGGCNWPSVCLCVSVSSVCVCVSTSSVLLSWANWNRRPYEHSARENGTTSYSLHVVRATVARARRRLREEAQHQSAKKGGKNFFHSGSD